RERSAVLKALHQTARAGTLTQAQFQNAVDLVVGVGVAVGVGVGLFYLVVGILYGRPWAWIFYVDLVLSGLSVISLVQSIAGQARGGIVVGNAISLVLSLVGLGLFIWLLTARIRTGVWATLADPAPRSP